MDREFWGNLLATQYLVADATEKRRILSAFEQAIRESGEPDFEKDFLLWRAADLRAQLGSEDGSKH